MTKQKFKRKEYTERMVVNNILRYYEIASTEDIEEGLIWYDKAHDFAQALASQYGLKVEQTSGVISALSPQTSWQINKMMASEFIRSNGKTRNGNQTRLSKARKILSQTDPEIIVSLLSTTDDGALKTKAFYRNILWPNLETDVTVDRHCIATCFQRPENTFALNNNEAKLTALQYMFIDRCYDKASDKVGIMKHQLQSITWLTYRNCRNLFKNKEFELPPLENDFSDVF